MQVITVPNILEPEKSFTSQQDFKRVIDYLQFQYPDGFEVPHVIFFNNDKLEVADYDKECGVNDFVTIAFSPAAPFITVALPYLIKFAIAVAISYVIGEIFKPDTPSGVLSSDQKSNGQASSVYNLNSNQNVTRLGQPIPILYGRTRVYPALIEQPYYRFKDNEMYLYQMMAVSAGDALIEELLIADSPEDDLGPDDIVYKSYQEDSFGTGAIKADILSTFGDDDYHMRIKTLPEVSGLELRGTPASSSMAVYFTGSTMTFRQYSNEDYPDLSSLVQGSLITISDTRNPNNSGVFIVDDADNLNHIITVQGHTFTDEPPVSTGTSSGSWINRIRVSLTDFPDVRAGDSLEITSNVFSKEEVTRSYIVSFVTLAEFDPVPEPDTIDITIVGSLTYGGLLTSTHDVVLQGSGVNAEFETSYGAYTLEDTPSSLDSIEVDIEYPRGIYNSDTSGNFTDRPIELEYKLIGSLETNWSNLNTSPDPLWPVGTTEQAKTNTPQRRTYNLPIPAGLTDNVPLKLRLRRSSAEVADIKSQDQAIVTRIKSIYNEPDITDYGNMTILWVRAKATNAISAQGQFQINAWVSRTDVASDLTSVITDLYTNAGYGAGLDATDLVLPEMIEPNTVIDTATDSGVVQTLTEYYIKDEIFNDSGWVSTATEYYNGTSTIYWGGVAVITNATVELTEYYDGTQYYYMFDDIGGGSYNVRRYEKYAFWYKIFWGGVQVYGTTTPLVSGELYLSEVDDYYYQVYENSPIEDAKYDIRRYKFEPTEYWAAFNGAIDSKMPVMDAIKMIAKAGRFNIYLDGQNVKMRKDEAQLVRTYLYNETNILKDSFKLDYLFGEDDGFDGVSVKYRSPTDFKENVATFPSNAINPEVFELIGCTDQALALSEATYGWLQKESRRKVAHFSTDIQGIQMNYLDRIGITHNVPEWGLSSNILAVNGNQITINCQLFGSSENLDYDTIIFRNKDGSVSDMYTFTIVGEFDILLDEAPPAWLYTGYDYDKTPFSMGVSNTFVKDYLVTEIAPKGNNVIDVTCINYDPDVYQKSPLVDGFGLILVDGSGNELY